MYFLLAVGVTSPWVHRIRGKVGRVEVPEGKERRTMLSPGRPKDAFHRYKGGLPR